MANVLLIGNGAREHAMAEAIVRSAKAPQLYSYMKANNPGIASLSKKTALGGYSDPDAIIRFAEDGKIDFAVIGPEDPLNNGIVDALARAGIPSFGPTKSLARLETSKTFTRELVDKYDIPGNPGYRIFTSMDGIEEFLLGNRGIGYQAGRADGRQGSPRPGRSFSDPARKPWNIAGRFWPGTLPCHCRRKTRRRGILAPVHHRRKDGGRDARRCRTTKEGSSTTRGRTRAAWVHIPAPTTAFRLSLPQTWRRASK